MGKEEKRSSRFVEETIKPKALALGFCHFSLQSLGLF